MITVVIPVGPDPDACRYLPEAIASVEAQTIETGILLVDDMHGVGRHADGCGAPMIDVERIDYVISNHWNLGVAASFNVGVACARTEHVLMLGADDWLEPDAIACAERAIREHPIQQAYYWFRVRYNDDRPERDQAQPCNAAVVTKALWRASGGFPVESAIGRPDVMLVGMLMGHPEVGTMVQITDNGTPPYNVRVHDRQNTATRGPWVRALEETAQAYWNTWQAPAWGRYE